ncbi:uncharacterized protein LOC110228253, partial [Arabidopsis lyrata subsp. lyrata]|uniref:uncharacterized protein LOC110228250 n=1 Tax=Arabidopsis lyrata subsp. lyrata TaxID=81972 RepID=UPI000A29D37E
IKVEAVIFGPSVSHLKLRSKLLFVDLSQIAFFLVFTIVESASLGCAVPWCRFSSSARTHFFQDLSWSNRPVSARVCRSPGFHCVGLFALRTAYSHTPEASVHSVRVDFVCWSFNRKAFFGSLDGLAASCWGFDPFELLIPQPLFCGPPSHRFSEHGFSWRFLSFLFRRALSFLEFHVSVGIFCLWTAAGLLGACFSRGGSGSLVESVAQFASCVAAVVVDKVRF